MTRRKEDQFDISEGNYMVLKMIPTIMRNKKWRKELRNLVLHYMMEEEVLKKPTRGKRS